MKKIILLIALCVMMGGVRGQGERNASVNVVCPPIYNAPLNQMFGLFFDTTGYFYYNPCNPWYWPTVCGENIIRFTPHCTNNYIFHIASPHDASIFPVSIKVSSFNYCDSVGYTCITPYSSVYANQNYDHYYNLTVDSNTTYDILIDYGCAGTYEPAITLGMEILTPHVSNVQFFDITPDSMSVSWDGDFDDMVIEYGPTGFTPGKDTIAGTNGILLHNPISPQTFTGLVPDSTYDFYFRDKCGVFSSNFLYRNRTARNPITLPWTGCNLGFWLTYYGSIYNDPGAWTLNTCVNATSLEYIYKFIPDSSCVDSIHHYATATNMYLLGVYYKKASLGMDEHNWICAGYGANRWAWTKALGPLEKDTLYYIMIKGERTTNGGLQGQFFTIYCPTSVCSTAPTGINSNIPNNTICSGQPITLNEVGGTLGGNGNFYWYADSCGGTSLGTGSVKIFYPTDTTTYYVRAEDSCGVTTCASITINVNPSPTPPTITGVTSFCQGGSSVLSAGFGYTSYLWSIASTTYSINVSTSGTYTVTVTNGYACTASASVTVTVHPLPVPVITGQLSFCNGGNTILDAGAGYLNYLWTTSAFTQTINVSTGGVYTVTVTDVNFCTGSASATVSVLPVPTAMLSGNASVCIGDCATLTVYFTGTPPFGYSYTDGVSTFGPYVTVASPVNIIVCPLVTSTYTLVSVFDANCAGTVSGAATVIVNPIPAPVITGLTEICPGSITTLNAGGGFANYQWSTGAASQTINTGLAGVYTVYVTDANGCTGSASVMVTVHPDPVAVINPAVTTYICVGDSVHFTANTGAGYMYQWYKKSIPIAGATNAYYDATFNGRYSFLLTDSNSCDSVSASVIVTIVCVPPLDPPDDRMAAVTVNEITIVPNPAKEEIQILNIPKDLVTGIKIYSAIGEIIFEPPQTTYNGQLTIDISHFSNGAYFVEINNGRSKVVKKFVKE